MDYDGAREYEAKAEAIMQAMRETAEHIVTTIERKAAYTRTGHHSKATGRMAGHEGRHSGCIRSADLAGMVIRSSTCISRC